MPGLPASSDLLVPGLTTASEWRRLCAGSHLTSYTAQESSKPSVSSLPSWCFFLACPPCLGLMRTLTFSVKTTPSNSYYTLHSLFFLLKFTSHLLVEIMKHTAVSLLLLVLSNIFLSPLSQFMGPFAARRERGRVMISCCLIILSSLHSEHFLNLIPVLSLSPSSNNWRLHANLILPLLEEKEHCPSFHCIDSSKQSWPLTCHKFSELYVAYHHA